MSNLKEELETPQPLEYSHDDVFGENTEHGPNFRSVHTSSLTVDYGVLIESTRSDSLELSFS
jgi:hypothetical protein